MITLSPSLCLTLTLSLSLSAGHLPPRKIYSPSSGLLSLSFAERRDQCRFTHPSSSWPQAATGLTRLTRLLRTAASASDATTTALFNCLLFGRFLIARTRRRRVCSFCSPSEEQEVSREGAKKEEEKGPTGRNLFAPHVCSSYTHKQTQPASQSHLLLKLISSAFSSFLFSS